MDKKRTLWLVLGLVCSISVWAEVAVDPEMRHVHDPTMIYAEGYYYVYSTGDTLGMRRSSDLINWDYLGSVFSQIPQWIKDKIFGVSNLWAPDITYHNGKYYLCYSASTLGSQTSLIALASNVTLNPYSPDYNWVDEGEIIDSPPSADPQYNAIDGTFVRDASGNMWLVFGSWWEGIMLTPLDNTTLKPTTSPPTIYHLARRSYSSAMEASYITYRNGYYYLFVNWDSCCSGVDSTYKIIVGRSASITGPYVDKNGVPLLYDTGGTLFVGTSGRWIGPGHADITTVAGQDYFSYHIYDGLYDGWATLRINEISWDEDLWPVLGNMVGVTPPDPPQGPTVAYWNFEDGTDGTAFSDMPREGSVDIANDYVMHGYDDYYGCSFSSFTPQGAGLSTRCADNHQDGYTLDAAFNAWSPQTWTIEVSVYLNDISGWKTIIGRDGATHGEPESDFYIQNNGIDDKFRVNFETLGGTRWILDGDYPVQPGQWYYLAVTSDGVTLKMYLDDGGGYTLIGSLDISAQSVTENALATNFSNWTFGRGWHDGGFVDHIDGYLDDIRFSEAVLTPSEFIKYQCGAWGYLQSDLDFNCIVDLSDFSLFASTWTGSLSDLLPFVNEWLQTTQPYAPGAVYGDS